MKNDFKNSKESSFFENVLMRPSGPKGIRKGLNRSENFKKLTKTSKKLEKTLQNKIDSLEKAMESKNETVVTIDVNTPESVENDS